MAKLNNPNLGKIGKHWKPGESGNPNGRPKGPSRTTIAKRVLEMQSILPDKIFEKLKELYPGLQQKMTSEELATIVQISNAISKGDTAAYKAVMDSAYGAPKQEIATTVNDVTDDFDYSELSESALEEIAAARLKAKENDQRA